METFEEKSELLRFIENSIRAGDATSDTDELTVNNDVVAYVSELLQCNVESLCAEEIRLNEVRRALQERKSALVLENYAVLLEASAQVVATSKDMSGIKSRLQDRLGYLVETEEMSRTFDKRIFEFGMDRERLREQSNDLNQVEDLLEVPALITNLIKSGLFEEATDLIRFAEKLAHQSPASKTLQAIAGHAKKRAWMIMNILANQLRTSAVQLLQVLRIVSLERRLGPVLNLSIEEYVRRDFLQARSFYIGTLVGAVSQRDTFHFIIKTVEICRLHFFETINHYLSVFPDNPELPADLRSLPYRWLDNELSELSNLVKQSLMQIEDSRLETLFSQCSNLAEALSRFGANMSPVFLDIFVTHVADIFRRSLQDATEARPLLQTGSIKVAQRSDGGQDQLQPPRFRYGALSIRFRKLIQSGLKKKPTSGKMFPAASDTDNTVKPPEELLQYPQLAILCNRIMAAFNRVRLCFFPNLIVPIIFRVNSLLQETLEILKEADDKENHITEEYEDVFLRIFSPFVERARDLLCPLQDASVVLGISLPQAKDLLYFRLEPSSACNVQSDSTTAVESNLTNGFHAEPQYDRLLILEDIMPVEESTVDVQ